MRELNEMTANEILTLEAIKLAGTKIDKGYSYANLAKVKSITSKMGMSKSETDEALASMIDHVELAPHQGNPSKFEDKADLLVIDGDIYCSVSTMQ